MMELDYRTPEEMFVHNQRMSGEIASQQDRIRELDSQAAWFAQELHKAEDRIRELEADNTSLKGGWLRAADRIRELEAQLKEFTPEDIRGMAYDTNALLNERIHKARGILMPLSDKDTRPFVIAMVRRALEALEGK